MSASSSPRLAPRAECFAKAGVSADAAHVLIAYLVGRSGLPPVRLHNLRQGAATLAHAVGADLKTM
jgi:hypothetical protein